MKYKLYRMSFLTAIHFGNGRLSSAENTFSADRLFSALCIEAKLLFGLEGLNRLVGLVKEEKLKFSDGMPFINDTYYGPKPIIHIEGDKESNSEMKKAFKKLKYIPINSLDDYFMGKLDAISEEDKLKKLGKYTQKQSVTIKNIEKSDPYGIGTYEFSNDCGLYFILGYESEEIFDEVDKLIYSLQYSGIGGKISSGLGKFETITEDISKDMEKRLCNEYGRYVSLSVSMANDNELSEVVEGAYYSLVKKGGFISSYDYADSQMKKKDFYCFVIGSCFTKRFEGGVFDLSGKGSHSVFKYAKPMLMGVDF